MNKKFKNNRILKSNQTKFLLPYCLNALLPLKKAAIVVTVLFLGFTQVFALEEGLSINTLPSGQKVIIKEVKDNAIVKIDTWINTGSINEDESTNGISHFLEHLFFKGTQKYPTGTFDKLLDSKGAVVNAATSKDYTHYFIELPSKDFDLALDLHADMMLNPMIPRHELEQERNVVIEEISKTQDSPSNRMFDNIFSLIYSKSNHPYKRTVIGTKELISKVTREEILAYFNRFYTPDAYTTVIVGDVDSKVALKKVEQAFKQDKRKQEHVKYPAIKPLDKIERAEDEMDINTNYSMVAFLAPKFNHKDNYALDVLSTMLSSGKSSILNQELKEKQDIVLSISAGNYSLKDSGIFYIYATYDPKNEQCFEQNVINELKKIQEGDFEDSILTKAKNQIKTDYYYEKESISNISSDLGYDFTFSSDSSYYENYLKNISNVTREDIIRVAKKYLLLDKYAISTIRPKNYKQATIKEIKPVAQTKPYKLIEEKDNTKKVLLNNGATLITKHKKANSIVAFNISIKGSYAQEKKPTTSLLTTGALTTGTTNFTNAQFAQFLDENGIKLGVSTSADVFTIAMQTTKENLDKAFNILNEIINEPSFQDNEINKIKQRKIQQLKTVSDSPSSYVFDEFKKLAFQNTIYGQNSEFVLKHINSVTRDDIKEFYSTIINPDNMSISVVGDVNSDYIAKKLNEIIKSNGSEKFQFSNYNYSQFKPTQNMEKTLTKNEVQANWMALGWKTCGILNRRDVATLSVINSILGEGMSSRLFVKLREQQGLAYTVGSNLNTNILDGAFITYIGTNAKSVEKAKAGLLNEIEILKKELVTTKELNDAKDKIMGKFLLSLETNMADANLLSWYSVLGRDLNAFEDYKKLIMEISQNDIIEAANKYFSKPYIYTVVMQKQVI